MDIFCKDFKPFARLSLEQIRFWIDIMKDHAAFINAGLGCGEAELRDEADRFHSIFESLEKLACEADCDDFTDIIAEVAAAVKRFFAFKRHLLHLALECRVDTHNPPLFYDHVSREALYFMRLLERMEECLKFPVESMTGETVFWTKLMADHLMFMLGHIDPSERQFAEKAVAFDKQFDQLHLQARDFDNMLWRFEPVPSFSRYVEDLEVNTGHLRELNQAAEGLVKKCCILSHLPLALAEHVQKETEYFLHTLEIIGNQLEPCDSCKCK